jgi:hypothetical protein
MQTLSEEQRSFKSVYSMTPVIQINYLLYQAEGGKSRVGSNRRGRKRERERERQEYIYRVRDGAK